LDEVQQRRSKVLELAAHDAPLAQIFEHLVAAVEFGITGGICTILRCKGNALEHIASGRTGAAADVDRGDRPRANRTE
jgi:hypothetical protein